MELPNPDDLIAEQISYYRARAPEYDDWWNGAGPWRRDGAVADRWQVEVAAAIGALIGFDARGDVLEIAAGTGNLTCHLARTAERLTAIDASPEALGIARSKLTGATHVDLVVADVFGWEPPQRYDAIVFGFWLSHVPTTKLASFWALVDRALADRGRVFLLDNSMTDAGGAQPNVERTWIEEEVSRRSLSDGRGFWIVKRAWSAEELESELSGHGWEAKAVGTGDFFIHATATRAVRCHR